MTTTKPRPRRFYLGVLPILWGVFAALVILVGGTQAAQALNPPTPYHQGDYTATNVDPTLRIIDLPASQANQPRP